MRRPLRSRVWFTKPQWYWFGWRTLVPFTWGGDEFDWHCWEFGWTVTGRVTISIRPCPITGKCKDILEEEGVEKLTSWPIDTYGNDHSKGDT